MPQGIQPILPVGPNGLPYWMNGNGSGSGGSGVANVNVVTLAASIVRQYTIDLATARKAVPLDLQGLKVYAVTVRKLAGTAASSVRLHLGGPEAQGLEISEGELRDGLTIKALAVTNDLGGGTLQLEIFGG